MKVKLLSEGIQRNGIRIAKKNLEDVVKNFKAPVPITLGHPKSDMVPAVGFFEKVELKDDGLYGEYSLSPLGQILLSSNNYRNVSAGLRKKPDGTWYLHHVALLGAVPPGAEDAEPLKVVNLSAEEGQESLNVETQLALSQEETKEEVKDMKDAEQLRKQVEVLSSAIKKEKITRLEETAKAKFSDELVKEIVEFAQSLPVEFSDAQEETLIDRLTNIVSKIPKPVQEGKKDFSDQKQEEVNFSDAVKAF